MTKYLYLALFGFFLSPALLADKATEKQKSIDAKISALTKDKVIFFSELAYFQHKTKTSWEASWNSVFSDKESYNNNIVSLHHPFCTKDLSLRYSFVARFELKNKPTEKQIDAIIKHYSAAHGALLPVLYFEIEKLEPNEDDGPTAGQVKIIGYGLFDPKKLREGTASNDEVIPNTYFTRDNFIPLSDD